MKEHSRHTAKASQLCIFSSQTTFTASAESQRTDQPHTTYRRAAQLHPPKKWGFMF